jgi:hypothetical protein
MIEWLGSAAAVGQVTLRSPRGLRPGVPLDISIPGVPLLRQPPAHYRFVLVRVLRDCRELVSWSAGPSIMTRQQAEAKFQQIISNVSVVQEPGEGLELRMLRGSVVVATKVFVGRPPGCGVVTKEGFQSQVIAGVPEEGGALGQASAPVTPGVFNLDLFTMQVLVNEVLARNNLPTVRDDGVLDQATCDRLLQIARNELGTVDPQLADLVLAHPELNNLCRGVSPLPPPPPPQAPPENPFEQCVVQFGDVSDAVRSVQRRINGELSARGYVPIPVDGTWNSVTCGALYFLTLVQGVPAEGPGSPFDIPECPGGMTVPTTCPDRVTPSRVGASTTTSKGGIGAGGLFLLAAAALGGIYLVTQVA